MHQSFVNDSNAGMDTLGQITSYAAAQLGAQFRTHVYSVLIVNDTARILRWDRSGTIVTEAIKYNKSRYLVDFFRQYSVAPAALQGKDETVSIPESHEIRGARDTLNLESTIPLLKVSVPGLDGSSRYFIVPTPETTPYTPPGHAMRGFRAYDPSRKDTVFLKDTWRIDMPEITPEGEVYAKLNAASVRNVPQCLASGDISTPIYHATRTVSYAQMPWACKGCPCHPNGPWVPHRHYRLILDVVRDPLMKYNSSREMVSAVRDALHGRILCSVTTC